MATRRSTRTRSTRSSRSSGRGGSLARFLLPAAALGIGAYLLWPRTASAAVLPPPAPPGPAPGPPNPLPPPPAPGGGGITIEPLADAPLTGGTSRGRITGSDVVVRNGFSDTSPVVSRLPLNAGVAVMIGPPAPPTPNAPQGRIRVRTARGAEGYVAIADASGKRLITVEPGAPGTAGWARMPGFYNA